MEDFKKASGIVIAVSFALAFGIALLCSIVKYLGI